MSTFPGADNPLINDIHFTDTDFVVALADGRHLSVPLIWYPRPLHASPGQLL